MSEVRFEGLTTQYPVDHIIGNLGLEVSLFDGRLLDMGCGKEARLVRHLRKLGIPAEGIDPELNEQNRFLMRGYGYEIPRPDRHYKFIGSHIAVFRSGTDVSDDFLKSLGGDLGHAIEYMRRNLDEGLRVLASGGRFVIWPAARYLMREIGRDLESKGVTVQEEETPYAHDERGKRYAGTFVDEFFHRTVLVKQSV